MRSSTSTMAEPTATALVCFDGSDDSATALRRAAALMPGLRAGVLHAWRPPPPSGELLHERDVASVDELVEELEREGRERARAVVEDGVAIARDAGWSAEPLLERSQSGVWHEVVRIAGEREPAVIVVGARGVGGAQAALGSVSDAVVNLSRWPVLVVHAAEGKPAGAPAVVAYDGSDPARRAVERAGALLAPRPAVVLTVAEGEDGDAPEVAEEGAELARAAGLDASARVERCGGSLLSRPDRPRWQAIVAVADDVGAAVTVVAARERSALRRLVLGSVSRGVVHHGGRPVLVVPEPDAEPGG